MALAAKSHGKKQEGKQLSSLSDRMSMPSPDYPVEEEEPWICRRVSHLRVRSWYQQVGPGPLNRKFLISAAATSQPLESGFHELRTVAVLIICSQEPLRV
jgi:hypothetical protein